METNKRTNKLRVISDPVYPNIEDIDKLRKDLERLEVLGIINIDFLFDEGIDIEYDSAILTPGMQLEGEKTLYIIGDTRPSFKFGYKFGYGEDVFRLCFVIKDGLDNILIEIPITCTNLIELSL